MNFKHICCVLFTLLMAASLSAKEYLVKTQQDYWNVAKQVKAGDTIKLANGTWQNFEILLTGKGKKNAPITLTAETKGKVIISGLSNLRIAGEYIVVSGLVFKNGYTPSSEVIAFRRNNTEFAYHSRITETVIEDFSNPDKREGDYWVALYGQYNRFDHNYLAGKTNKGVTLAVRLINSNSQQNYHQIDHNYFGPRQIFGSNGGESLRIGTSHFSMFDSHTLVENNYFDRCNGEVEIISVKSGKNHIRNNVFFESRGTLTLRHGNGNLIENNVFLGNGVDHTGGIRVINKDQIVRNNYLEGLTGYRFGSGLTIMNGVPNSPVNRYQQVDNALISNNSFINVEHIQLAAGSDAERSATPINTKIENNLFVNENKHQPFAIFDDISGIQFANNIANIEVLDELKSGFIIQPVKLERAENGLLYPTHLEKGVSRNLQPIQKMQTGPSWYPKAVEETAFNSGKTIHITAKPDALLQAVSLANDGDVIELAPGHYNVRKIIAIDKTLTIKAEKAHLANVTFERGTLFEIQNGGSLSLNGLKFNGRNSPDYAGNSLVRTKKWGMSSNYRLLIENSIIENLDINHSFNVIATGKGAFANKIVVRNNQFTNVTGDILKLDSETEDLGVYNAEYVIVEHNKFNEIQGAIVRLYRGGSDESTFGPHLTFVDNQVLNSGQGKRNSAQASLVIHGVQVTTITHNVFENSAPILVNHTVGEPKTLIEHNQFINTAKPKIVELHFKGPISAIVRNNVVK
jgi:poly(beta-D-mannuronate) lyase